MESTERDQSQTAYQVIVASTEARLRQNTGDVWDSGKVSSDQSVHVAYSGQPLTSWCDYFWKVRAWDKTGKVSDWSKPARWTMGILNPGEWSARWIGYDESAQTNYLSSTHWIWFPEGTPQESAPPGTRYFRRAFDVPRDRQIRTASLRIAADNECRVFLNGRDLGSRSGFNSAREWILTSHLEPGRNVLGVSGSNTGNSPTPAGVVALLRIEFDRGDPVIIATDAKWKCSDRESENWTGTNFQDTTWPDAKDLGPVGMQPWGKVQSAEDRRLPARWLRKGFAVDKSVRRAIVCFSGLGWSELYLNGRKVGDEVLSPGMTDYPKHVFYVTHDVTKQLRRGENAIGALLGNAFFYAPRSRTYSSMQSYGFPKMLLQLRIEYVDGSVSNVVSDESWKLTTDGPILANNVYDGEEYDARKELSGWSERGFNDLKWRLAQLVSAPEGAPVVQPIEPIRVTGTLKPIAVTEPKPGVFIFDMGQNLVGWCRLHVSGPAGTRVQMRHAETLQPDGTLYAANLRSAEVTDVYTLKGRGTETWEPRFTYHGFRYVEVTGFPGRPTLASFEGRVVNDDVRSAGEFQCSNPLLNQIYRNVVWGVRGNYHSFPTDCPQRDERQGWLGDRAEESRGETFIFDTEALHAKWIQDMADSQQENGTVPDVCPPYWPIYRDDVTWPSASVFLPGMLRDQFGNAEIIKRHYPSVKKWIDHMLGYMTNGIIAKDNYGDWCVPPEDLALIHSRDPKRITDKALLATSFFYHDLRLMEGYAKLLGNTDDAQHFARFAEEIRTAFNARFLNRELGQYDNGTQTSCVLPLAFDLVPDDMRARVFDHLVKKISDESKGHIGTGLVGGQFLMRVLSENGRPDLAYTITTQKDYPGWGYMVEHGATTIWELWNGNTADPAMNSGNHVMLVGDLVIWLYENLAGIKSDPAQPGFKHIIMKPTLVGDLKRVKATHRSPYGLISSEWHRDGKKFDWKIEIPPNTTATVCVLASSIDSVREGSLPALKARGIRQVRYENGRDVFELGSGKYHFVSE